MHDTLKSIFQTLSENAEENFIKNKNAEDYLAEDGLWHCGKCGTAKHAPESQEVVRVDFHDTDPIPYEQPLNVILATTERNNLSVAEPMKLSVGSFHLTIPTLLII